MEKLELNRQPEITDQKLKNLKSIIDSLKFENFEKFEFDGKNFLLMDLEPEEVEKGDEAWFAESTMINGVDIYLLKTLSLENKKQKLFHEVLEVWAMSKGYFENAHDFAVEKEQKLFNQRI